MKPEDTAKKLISAIGDSFLPYATVDKIIEAVKKDGPEVRNEVMLLLFDYLKDAMRRREETDKIMYDLKDYFENKKIGDA